MKSPARRAGVALLSVILVAINLRTAVAVLSPVMSAVTADIPMTVLQIGLVGVLPPACFAIFGILTPWLAKAVSLELATTAAMAVVVAGLVVRSAAPNYALLTAGSTIAFAGMAAGNVLLPPLVGDYFPHRIGLVTALYSEGLAMSTLLPPLVAVPVTERFGWRIASGMWAVAGAAAIVPLVILFLAQRRGARRAAAEAGPQPILPSAAAHLWRTMAGSTQARAIAALFAINSLHGYTMFAWLPQIFIDTAGVSPAHGGALLSAYAAMTVVTGLLIPIWAARAASVLPIATLGTVLLIIAYSGLLFAPAAVPLLWATLAGLGTLHFPLALVLINAHSSTRQQAIAVSSFGQGIGYVVASAGPIGAAALHEAFGGWAAPLTLLLVTSLAGVAAGAVVGRARSIFGRSPAPDGRRISDPRRHVRWGAAFRQPNAETSRPFPRTGRGVPAAPGDDALPQPGPQR